MRSSTHIRYRGQRITSAVPREPIALAPRPAWMTSPDRACAPDHGADALFTSNDTTDLNDAAFICRSAPCPFIEQCWAYAVEHGETNNVWGGQVFSSSKVQREAAAERGARGLADGADRIEQALTSDPRLINSMGPDERAELIRAGVARGMGVSALAGWFRRTNRQIRDMLPADERPALQPQRRRPDLDERVRELYDADQPDTAIALKLGYSQNAICHARRRMHLPSKFGPGGRRLAVNA